MKFVDKKELLYKMAIYHWNGKANVAVKVDYNIRHFVHTTPPHPRFRSCKENQIQFPVWLNR